MDSCGKGNGYIFAVFQWKCTKNYNKSVQSEFGVDIYMDVVAETWHIKPMNIYFQNISKV
jgi:hypothetical protein